MNSDRRSTWTEFEKNFRKKDGGRLRNKTLSERSPSLRQAWEDMLPCCTEPSRDSFQLVVCGKCQHPVVPHAMETHLVVHHGNPHMPVSNHQSGSHKGKPNKRNKEYNPDIHCGVWLESEGRHCVKSLTCKVHPIAEQRNVGGRSRPFDELLRLHREQREQQKREKEKEKSSKNPAAQFTTKSQLTTSKEKEDNSIKSKEDLLPLWPSDNEENPLFQEIIAPRYGASRTSRGTVMFGCHSNLRVAMMDLVTPVCSSGSSTQSEVTVVHRKHAYSSLQGPVVVSSTGSEESFRRRRYRSDVHLSLKLPTSPVITSPLSDTSIHTERSAPSCDIPEITPLVVANSSPLQPDPSHVVQLPHRKDLLLAEPQKNLEQLQDILWNQPSENNFLPNMSNHIPIPISNNSPSVETENQDNVPSMELNLIPSINNNSSSDDLSSTKSDEDHDQPVSAGFELAGSFQTGMVPPCFNMNGLPPPHMQAVMNPLQTNSVHQPAISSALLSHMTSHSPHQTTLGRNPYPPLQFSGMPFNTALSQYPPTGQSAQMLFNVPCMANPQMVPGSLFTPQIPAPSPAKYPPTIHSPPAKKRKDDRVMDASHHHSNELFPAHFTHHPSSEQIGRQHVT